MKRRIFHVTLLLGAAILASCGGGGGGGGPVGPGGPPGIVPNPTSSPAGTYVLYTSLTIPNPPVPNGVPTTVPLQVVAYDSNFNRISGVYQNPITLTITTNSAVSLSKTTLTTSSDVVTLTYDGHSLVNPIIHTNMADINPGYGDAPSPQVFRPQIPGAEYQLPSGNQTGWTMADASDGSIWFPEFDGVGRITTAGSISEFPVATNGDGVVSRGPDGNAWLISSGPPAFQFVAKLGPSGIVSQYPATTSPYAPYLTLTSAPDGKMYYPSPGAINTIQTDGTTAQAFVFNYPGIPPPAPVNGIIFTETTTNSLIMMDGQTNLYTCTYTGQCTVQTLPPDPGYTGGSAPPMHAVAGGIAANGDLLVESGQSLVQMSPSGTVRWGASVPGYLFSAAPIAALGYVWAPIGNDATSNRPIIDRFASDGSSVQFVGPTGQASSIGAMIVGPDGNVWYTRGSSAGVLHVPASDLAPASHLARKF